MSLHAVLQAGATGVVTALHNIPNGQAWPKQEIEKRQRVVAEASPGPQGLRWSVVESLPVHEEIKWGGPRSDQLLDSYRQSLRNLGESGVRTVCYNFMPVLDWTRTDLEHRWFDGSTALAFSMTHLVAFDLLILKRENAGDDYPKELCAQAEALFKSLSQAARERLTQTIAAGLPGSEESYGLDELRSRLSDFAGLKADDLRNHLRTFLEEVVPTAEQYGVHLALHPDDPPRAILGLPRVVSSADDLTAVLEAVSSPSNGLTFCTGSLGASADNDVESMAQRFAKRIHFAHLRNVQRGSVDGDFIESDHLTGDVNMVDVVRTLLEEERGSGRVLPMRPDHGHAMLDDLNKAARPGYTAIGRLRGLAELRGIEAALRLSAIRS